MALALGTLAVLDVALVLVYEDRVRHFAASHQLPRASRYDAAVVFFGGLDANRQLDSETRRRVHSAAELVVGGRVRRIIAVGGARPGWPRTGSAIMADSLRARGVPPDSISSDSVSYDSFSNWDQAVRIARSRGLDSLVLVSSLTHLMRLRHFAASGNTVVAFHPGERDRTAEGAATRWATAHRESLALAALWFLPRTWYVSILKRIRVGT